MVLRHNDRAIQAVDRARANNAGMRHLQTNFLGLPPKRTELSMSPSCQLEKQSIRRAPLTAQRKKSRLTLSARLFDL
jgi:hypothetical protein